MPCLVTLLSVEYKNLKLFPWTDMSNEFENRRNIGDGDNMYYGPIQRLQSNSKKINLNDKNSKHSTRSTLEYNNLQLRFRKIKSRNRSRFESFCHQLKFHNCFSINPDVQSQFDDYQVKTSIFHRDKRERSSPHEILYDHVYNSHSFPDDCSLKQSQSLSCLSDRKNLQNSSHGSVTIKTSDLIENGDTIEHQDDISGLSDITEYSRQSSCLIDCKTACRQAIIFQHMSLKHDVESTLQLILNRIIEFSGDFEQIQTSYNVHSADGSIPHLFENFKSRDYRNEVVETFFTEKLLIDDERDQQSRLCEIKQRIGNLDKILSELKTCKATSDRVAIHESQDIEWNPDCKQICLDSELINRFNELLSDSTVITKVRSTIDYRNRNILLRDLKTKPTQIAYSVVALAVVSIIGHIVDVVHDVRSTGDTSRYFTIIKLYKDWMYK
ncbi:hypothetical protein GJ496_007915 [Pomphorhynchus laevis]|nr:hypothetical protein GJ496_007915 [Pomphorhynchus laevis]